MSHDTTRAIVRNILTPVKCDISIKLFSLVKTSFKVKLCALQREIL